jgi:cyclomaltodextrinase / maltogenic alpha-amylase / neopullulanase
MGLRFAKGDFAVPGAFKRPGRGGEEKSIEATRSAYKKLFLLRTTYPALTRGDVVWINNTEPASVLSFMRKQGDSLSNRQLHVTVDLPVMDYYSVENLLSPGKTWLQLYSGRVSADLGAFAYVVGRKIPLAPLAADN